MLAVAGCGSSSESGGGAAPAAGGASGDKEPFVLGDLIEPFDPPTLEELDATVEWEDSRVVDALALLREQKEKEPPLVSVEQALQMRNDSPRANEEILSALSEVPDAEGDGVKWDATLNRGLAQDLRSMNAVLQSSNAEQDVAGLIAFGIFGFDWNMVPLADAGAVVSWQTSKDHLYDKVVLRDDLTWSDGQPITAYDVEFSFKVILSSQVPVPAQRQGTEEMKAVKAYDAQTLVYFHKRSEPTNVWNLNFSVIPKHIYGQSIKDDPTLRTSDYHKSLEVAPVTGGPYEVERWSRSQEIVLRRRESYYMHDGKQMRDKPYYERVRYRIIEDVNTSLLALKKGEIDESLLGAEQWQTQTNDEEFYRHNTKVMAPEWTFFFIGWNLDAEKCPFFVDLRVRKAMAYAMNYDEMLEDLCYGLYPQCHGIYHPDAWMFPKNPPPLYRQDLDMAEDLLDEAGWADSDGDGVRDKEINGRVTPFEFTLLVSNKPDRIAICNLFRESLESIGILCNVQPIEAAVFQDRVFNKNFQAWMMGWGAGTDPYLGQNIWGTGEDRNYGSYSNPEVDRLYAEGMKEFDPSRRAEIYAEIHNLLYEDQVYLFLYNRSSFYGFNKELRGYRFSPRGPFHYSPGFFSIWTPAL